MYAMSVRLYIRSCIYIHIGIHIYIYMYILKCFCIFIDLYIHMYIGLTRGGSIRPCAGLTGLDRRLLHWVNLAFS